MNPNNLISLEILKFGKNRRTLLTKIALPLILTLPIIFFGIPLPIKVSIFIAIIIFISTFSSTVGVIQIRESKMVERLLILPIPKYRLTLEFIVAKFIVDTFKFYLPLLLFLIVNGNQISISAINIIELVTCFYCSIIVSNAFGFLIGNIAKSSGDAHLFAMIFVLILTWLSGIFNMGGIPTVNFIATLLPYRYLYEILSLLTGNSSLAYNYLYPIISTAVILGISTVLASNFYFRSSK